MAPGRGLGWSCMGSLAGSQSAVGEVPLFVQYLPQLPLPGAAGAIDAPFTLAPWRFAGLYEVRQASEPADGRTEAGGFKRCGGADKP